MTSSHPENCVYAHSARPAVDAPPLDGDARADVAIIGGGYTGLSTALHLAERGIGAIVLEAQSPGWGASGRNGGHVNPGLYPDPASVLADFGAERGGRMLAFAAAAPDFAFGLIDRLGIDCEPSRTGTLRAAYHASRLPALRATHDQWTGAGLSAEWLDAAAIAAATGSDRYLSAMRYPNGGHLNPLSYARGLAAAAVAAGARICGDTPALRIARRQGGWAVETPRGAVEASRIVIATNGYTGPLWPKLADSVVPVYSTIAATEPLPADLAAAILPSRSVLYEIGFNTVYYRLDAQDRLLMGGRGAQRDARSPADARHLTAYAVRLWPGLAGVGWTHAWNGKVAMTADRYPHLHEPAEGIHVALGYNGRGVAMASAMGALLARRIAGERAEDLPMPVTGIAPFPWRRFARLGVEFRLAYGRLRDWCGI